MSPRSGKAGGGEANEPELGPDAVPAETESATEGNEAADVEETTDEVEDGTSVSEDVEDTDDVDAESVDEPSDDESEADHGGKDGGESKPKRTISVSRILAFGVLPCLVLLLAVAGAYLKWQAASLGAAQTSSVESLAAAKDGTAAMLSYQPDTVEKDLGGARDRLTGVFKDSYTQLTHDVVIPGAKQRHISAVATVPAAASVSATASHAVALVFVNQTVVVGNDPPSATASSVRVTMDKVGQRWLISGFDPV